MEVDDDGNTNGVVIRPGAGDNVILGNILGTLFENNYASGTIAGTNMSTSFAWEVWEVDHHSGMEVIIIQDSLQNRIIILYLWTVINKDISSNHEYLLVFLQML